MSVKWMLVWTLLLCCLGDRNLGATDVVGEVDFANSGAAAAQAAFLHGVAQLHNFEYADAANDFRRAQQIDPNFALAYWGEAMTYNHPVWNQQDRPAALSALQRLGGTPEERLAKAPTEREKEYLGAIQILYGAQPDEAKPERDRRYAEAMEKLHARFPQDLDAAAFYALALMGTTQGVRDERVYMRAAAVLMPLFYKHPSHPGLAHYLIHSCDDPIHAPLALAAAESYSRIASNAPHALHMTSHIFIAMGLWSDVVQANLLATQVANWKRATAQKGPSRCGHYNYWLEYGYIELGNQEAAKAIVSACRAEAAEPGRIAAASHVVDPDDSSVSSFLQMQARYVIDTADWKGPVAGWTIDIGSGALVSFNHALTDGYISAMHGNVHQAHQSLEELRRLEPGVFADFDHAGVAADDPRRLDLEIEMQELKALILAREGNFAAAIDLAQKAAEAESKLAFAFGPPDPIKPAAELLGELLLQAGQAQKADAAFRQALLRAPGRIQSSSHADSLRLPKATFEMNNERIHVIPHGLELRRLVTDCQIVPARCFVRVFDLPDNIGQSVRRVLPAKNMAPWQSQLLPHITGMDSPSIHFFGLARAGPIFGLFDDPISCARP